MANEQAVAFDELFSNATRMVGVLRGNLERLTMPAAMRRALRVDLKELKKVAAQQAAGELKNWSLTDLPGAK